MTLANQTKPQRRPMATVIVNFEHEGGRVIQYSQAVELTDAIAGAIDLLLNHDADGQPRPFNQLPLGVDITAPDKRAKPQ